MAEPERIPSHKITQGIFDVLNRIFYRGESFIITRKGRDEALLSPLPEEKPKAKKQTKVA